MVSVTGGEEMQLAVAANENRPKLRAFDRAGHRTDDVEFHPAYHRLMELGVANGVRASPGATRRARARTSRAPR